MGGKTPSSSSARLPEYTTNALAQIRKDLCKFSHPVSERGGLAGNRVLGRGTCFNERSNCKCKTWFDFYNRYEKNYLSIQFIHKIILGINKLSTYKKNFV